MSEDLPQKLARLQDQKADLAARLTRLEETRTIELGNGCVALQKLLDICEDDNCLISRLQNWFGWRTDYENDVIAAVNDLKCILSRTEDMQKQASNASRESARLYHETVVAGPQIADWLQSIERDQISASTAMTDARTSLSKAELEEQMVVDVAQVVQQDYLKRRMGLMGLQIVVMSTPGPLRRQH
ncbi:hypothetical protein MBLNU13_g09660t1 [Cladosporium sp. NU13]